MTIHTIDEALAYLSRDLTSVEAECEGVLRAELGRLKADQEQGGKDYCRLADKSDAWQVRALDAEDRMRVMGSELTRLRAMTQCSMGVGNGSGNLHVHGDYESIKAAQRFVFAVERARALVESWRAGVAHRRGPSWDGRLENSGDGRGPAFDRAILMMANELEAALSGKEGK